MLEEIAAQLEASADPELADVERYVGERLVELRLDGPASAEELGELDERRPKTRADCLPGGSNEYRPCPWLSCRWHLAGRVRRNGTLMINSRGYRGQHPRSLNANRVRGGVAVVDQLINLGVDLILAKIPETCALDVADSGEHSYAEIGELMGIHARKAEEIAENAMAKLRAAGIKLPTSGASSGE